MGRPAAKIDWELCNKLMSLPPVITIEDIAFILGVHKDTLANQVKSKHKCTISEYRVKRASHFRLKIINKQIQTALAGSITMLIWLGKNYLGQSDQQNIDHSVMGDDKLVIDLGELPEPEDEDGAKH